MNNQPIETLIVVVKDGLLLPSGFFAASSYTCNLFCRVPALWVTNGQLGDIYLERLYERLYGENWRAGNSDGSRYAVQDSFSQVFAPDVVKNTQWSGTENTSENHFWFYLTDADGTLRSVTPAEFQADVEASVKS